MVKKKLPKLRDKEDENLFQAEVVQHNNKKILAHPLAVEAWQVLLALSPVPNFIGSLSNSAAATGAGIAHVCTSTLLFKYTAFFASLGFHPTTP